MASEGTLPDQLPLFLNDADIAQLADVQAAMEVIRAAYQAPGEPSRTPGRIFAESPQEWARIMPSIPGSGRLFGFKSIVGSFRSELRVSYLISLFDKETAHLAALIDGNRVTGLRTAATTAVGASTIVPGKPLRVAVIGSGFEARSHLEALAHVAQFSEIRVFSPTQPNREAFARDFDGLTGASAVAVDLVRTAVEGADLVLCAARSRDETPTLDAEYVSKNASIVSIGSTTPAQRELPIELIDQASTIVVDTFEEVVHGSGDMRAAKLAGIDVESKVVTLGDALRRDAALNPDEGIRIYKSTGSGLQDIVVAEMLVDRARADGYGTELPSSIVTTRK